MFIVSRLYKSLYLLISVIYTCIFFMFFRVQTLLAILCKYLTSVKLFKPVFKIAPIWRILLFAILILFSTEYAGEYGGYLGIVANVLEICTWLIFVAFYIITAEELNTYPKTFEGVETHIDSYWPEKRLSEILHNRLDAILIRIIINNSVIIIPAWIYFCVSDGLNVYNAFFYLVVLFTIFGPHETLDHSNIHSHIFKTSTIVNKKDRLLVAGIGCYLDYILNPLCMRIPHHYAIQHLITHHGEDNGPDDTQSTMHYDPTSFVDFSKASLKFGIEQSSGLFTIRYLLKRKRWRHLKKLLTGLLMWYAALLAIGMLNSEVAVYIAVIRFLSGVPLMMNIYMWHAFVDQDDPDNIYKSTVNIIDTDSNHGYFGALLHLEHHIYPGIHWSKLMQVYLDDIDNHICNETILFRLNRIIGIKILYFLWTRKPEEIAKMCLLVENDKRGFADLCELISRRMGIKYCPHTKIQAPESIINKVAARLLIGRNIVRQS